SYCSELLRCWAVSHSFTVLNCRGAWWHGSLNETICRSRNRPRPGLLPRGLGQAVSRLRRGEFVRSPSRRLRLKYRWRSPRRSRRVQLGLPGRDMDPDRRGLRMARIKERESPVKTAPTMSGVSAPEPSFLDSLQPSGPPKKRRTSLIVLVIVLALALVGIVGRVAIIGSTGKAI